MPAVLYLACAIFGAALIVTAHLDHSDRLDRLDKLMALTQADLDNLTTQVRRGISEVTGRIASLQSQIDAGVPTEELDITGLAAAAQALDDVVADSPAE